MKKLRRPKKLGYTCHYKGRLKVKFIMSSPFYPPKEGEKISCKFYPGDLTPDPKSGNTTSRSPGVFTVNLSHLTPLRLIRDKIYKESSNRSLRVPITVSIKKIIASQVIFL